MRVLRPTRIVGLLALVCVAGSLFACKNSEQTATPSLFFPGLSDRLESVNAMVLRGAGNATLVTLEKNADVWRVRERDWPADVAKINQTLLTIAQAHRAQAKTEDPALYPRLGLEPIVGKDAQGVQISLRGAGVLSQVLVGHEDAKLDASYVRVDGEARTWLADRSLAVERNPDDWLDHSLIDLPLARIVQVRVEPRPGRAFTLVHRDDRFGPDDVPAAAIANSHQGDALAGILDQLKFENVAADTASMQPERTLRFFTVDGRVIDMQAWRIGGRVWLRLSSSLDEARVKFWLAQSADNANRLPDLRQQVDTWNARFKGHRFLMPNFQAAILLLSREQIIKGL